MLDGHSNGVTLTELERRQCWAPSDEGFICTLIKCHRLPFMTSSQCPYVTYMPYLHSVPVLRLFGCECSAMVRTSQVCCVTHMDHYVSPLSPMHLCGHHVIVQGRVPWGRGVLCVPTWGVIPGKHGLQAALPSEDVQPICGGHQNHSLPFRSSMLVHAGHGILAVLQLENTLGYPLFLVLLVHHHFIQNPRKRANQDVSADRAER